MSPLPESKQLGKKEQLEMAPSIPVAAERLFGMFGELKKGNKLPEQTSELLNEYKLYPSYGGNPLFFTERFDDSGYYWSAQQLDLIIGEPSRTNKYRADSPIIKSGWIEGAGEIITVTDSHHKLGWGPDHDIILALTRDGGKGWGFRKRQDKETGRPWGLDSWNSVSRLLTKEPGEGNSCAKYELWELYQSPYYTLKAGFSSKGMSMLELLTELGKD